MEDRKNLVLSTLAGLWSVVSRLFHFLGRLWPRRAQKPTLDAGSGNRAGAWVERQDARLAVLESKLETLEVERMLLRGRLAGLADALEMVNALSSEVGELQGRIFDLLKEARAAVKKPPRK
jgi:hypothetical protein